jgi:endonuclease/exonuclease/phosphatase family metal-dependent hydrolase
VHLACVHLSLRSSRRQRTEQMERVVKAMERRPGPALIGGDWNTTTYNSDKAYRSILGFGRRALMGVGHVIRNHYPYPDRFFEKGLFRMLERRGFENEGFNVPGGCTVHYSVEDPQVFENLGDWVPRWCFRFGRWGLRDFGGWVSLKLDWLVGRGLEPGNPLIPQDLPRGQNRLSDHEPVMVDLRCRG